MQTPPLEQVAAMGASDYFSLGAELLRTHPPHLSDWSTLERIRKIGIRPDGGFDADHLDDAGRAVLEGAPAEAIALMKVTLPRLARVVNGWQMNTDTMGVYGDFYLKRAIVAMVGQGANQPEDAIYPLNMADADGRPLDGEHQIIGHDSSLDDKIDKGHQPRPEADRNLNPMGLGRGDEQRDQRGEQNRQIPALLPALAGVKLLRAQW